MKEIEKTKHVFAMSKGNLPQLRILPGELVRVHTCDCFSDAIRTEQTLLSHVDFDEINPATGPIFVEGALPGDTLKIEIRKIETDRQGVMLTAPGFGLLGEEAGETETRILPIEDGQVRLFGLSVPARPMIGVIGTAPAEGEIETGTPGEHGGNMDCTLIAEGATLYLPVSAEGALLALGDLHALMGDGEISVTGVETAGCVELKIDVLKDKHIPTPFVENEDVCAAICSAPTLEEASKGASRQMIRYLREEANLTFNEAYMLLSALGKLAVCQVVDPLVTMRMELPREILRALR